MSDNYELILSRLQRVKRTSSSTAIASCPVSTAHKNGDKHPSLTIRDKGDGTILVRCQSQLCGFSDIVSALGMRDHDFFPPRPDNYDYRAPLSRPFPAGDVLACIGNELVFSYLVISDFSKGIAPTEETQRRFLESVEMVNTAVTLALGRDPEAERDEIMRKAELTPREEKDIEEFLNA
jgi:hypothetical protein